MPAIVRAFYVLTHLIHQTSYAVDTLPSILQKNELRLGDIN